METNPPRRRRAQRRRSAQITERDRRLLAYAAEHRFVLAAQVGALLGVSDGAADARMRALEQAGYLVRERRLHGEPASNRITPAGLRAIGSDLAAPRRVDLAVYRHDLGLGWLMLAAHQERFGPVQAVISERRMRSEDERAPTGEARARHGVRLGGTGPRGRDRLHYPDMVLVTDTGHQVAFELELTTKAPARREQILAGYAADPSIDLVVYLVETAGAGAAIERSAARVGISHLVRANPVTLSGPPPSVPNEQGAQRGQTRAQAAAESAREAAR